MRRVYFPFKTRTYLSKYQTSTNFYKPPNNYNRNNRNILSSQLYSSNKLRTRNNIIRSNLNMREPIIRENINITNIKYQPYKEYVDNEIDLLNLKMRCDLISHKLNRIKYYLNDGNNNINLNQHNLIEGIKNKSEYINEKKYNFNNEDIINNNNDDNIKLNKVGNINNIYDNNNDQNNKNQNILEENIDNIKNGINYNMQITNNYLSIKNKGNINNDENNFEFNINNEYYNDINCIKQMNNKIENKNEIDFIYSPYEKEKINQDKELLNNNNIYRAVTFAIDTNQDNNKGMKEKLLIENQANLNLKNDNIEEVNKNEIQNDNKYEFKKNNLKNYKHAKMLFDEVGLNAPMNIYNLYIKNSKNNEDNKDELNNKIINNSEKENQNNSFDKYNNNNINKNDAKEIMNNLENNKKYFKSYLEKMNNINNINVNKFDEIDDKYMNDFNDKNDENNEDGNINNNNNNEEDIFNEMGNNNKNVMNKSRNINKVKQNKKYKDNNNIDKNNEIKENSNNKNKNLLENKNLDLMTSKENNIIINSNIQKNDDLKDINPTNKSEIINSSKNKYKGKNNNAYNNSLKQKYRKILPTSNLYKYNNIVSKDKNKDNRDNRYKTIVFKDIEKNKTSINDNDKSKKYYNNKRAKSSRRNYNNDISNKLKLLDLQMDENPKASKTENAIDDDFLYQLRLNKSEDNIKLVTNKEEIESLIDKDKERLMRYDPIRRNIEMIKNIESYKKQGIVFPGIKRERKVREAPLKYCYKFRLDPQKFYTELLCDSMYEALDFKVIKNNK